MNKRRLHDQLSLSLQEFHDFFVRGLNCVSVIIQLQRAAICERAHLDILAYKIGYFGREFPRLVDRARRHLVWLNDIMSQGNAVIVFTKRRCLMDNTGTIVGADVFVYQYAECFVLVLGRKFRPLTTT